MSTNTWSNENAKLETLASGIAEKMNVDLTGKHYVIDLDATLGNGKSGICSIAKEANIKADGKKHYVITVHTPVAHNDAHLCAELGVALLLIAYSPSGKQLHLNKKGILKAETLNLKVTENATRGATLTITETFMELFAGMESGLSFTAVKPDDKPKKDELPALDTYDQKIQNAVINALNIVQAGLIERKELTELLNREFRLQAGATKAAKKAAAQNQKSNASKDKGLKADTKPKIV